MDGIGRLKKAEFVPRIGKIISLELLAKRTMAKNGSKSKTTRKRIGRLIPLKYKAKILRSAKNHGRKDKS